MPVESILQKKLDGILMLLETESDPEEIFDNVSVILEDMEGKFSDAVRLSMIFKKLKLDGLESIAEEIEKALRAKIDFTKIKEEDLTAPSTTPSPTDTRGVAVEATRRT